MKKIQKQIDKIKKSIANKNFSDNSITTYNKLNEIENSLYRYDQLSKAGLKDEAKTERTNVNNLISNFNSGEEGTVLKGGISNTVYIWRANGDNPCELCEDLDGTEYEYAEDIPDKPHPNCNCYIEKNVVQDGDGEEDEPCDCVERLDALIAELEEIVGDAESLEDEAQTDSEDVEKMASDAENMIAEMDETLELLDEEYGQHLPDCEYNIDAIYDEITIKKEKLEALLTDILDFLETIKAYLEVLSTFISNYVALLYEAYVLREEGMDKYYHSVANCQSAQLGDLESEIATALSDKKELYDQYTYVQTHKVTIEEAIADSERDQIANRLGRERGRNNPTCDCRVLMQDLKPERRR